MTDEEIADAIRDLPDLEPPAGWEDRLEARRARAIRRRHANRVALLYGLGTCALCALGYYLFRN